MNKQELIREISNRVEGATQKDIAVILDTFQEVIKDTVATNEDVKLAGFLTFSKKHVNAKSGISRIGGVEKPWTTEAKDEVAVKISKAYKVI